VCARAYCLDTRWSSKNVLTFYVVIKEYPVEIQTCFFNGKPLELFSTLNYLAVNSYGNVDVSISILKLVVFELINFVYYG